MASVRFDLREIDNLAEKLREAQNLDVAGIMNAIGVSLVSSVSQRFQMGIDPDGMPWQPSRRAASQGGKTLMDTSRLEKSVTYVTYPESGQVDVGTDVIYGRIHQDGGTITAKGGGYLKFIGGDGGFVQIKSVNMPKRSYLGINDQDKQVIVGIVQSGIRRALQGI